MKASMRRVWAICDGVTPTSQERLLFASITYRPEWQATSTAGALRVQPVDGDFLSVTVPPGVGNTQLDSVPRTHIVLTWFSSLAFLVMSSRLRA